MANEIQQSVWCKVCNAYIPLRRLRVWADDLEAFAQCPHCNWDLTSLVLELIFLDFTGQRKQEKPK